jgi:CHAT domain-containing protein/Tfp pilus assembly protein PilF
MRYLIWHSRRRFPRMDAFVFSRLVSGFCRALIVTAVAFSATSSASSGHPPGAPEDDSYILRPGEVVTRNTMLNEPKPHFYRLSLAQKQYVHIVVEQKGIDVTVRLLDPNGILLMDQDSPNGKFGPEAVSTVAEAEGNFIIEVVANKQPAGSYELRVEGPRESTAEDHKRVTAERFVWEAQRSPSLAPTNSLIFAIERYKEAQAIWHEIGDVREEGYAQCSIGEKLRALGNSPDAAKHLEQALSLLDQAQDRAGQAYALNELGGFYRDSCRPSEAFDSYERALALRTRLGDKWGEAQLLNNIGTLFTKYGQSQKALEYLESSLPLWRETGDSRREMQALNNIAKVQIEIGNMTQAFQQLEEVLSSCKPNEPCYLEPFARNSRGIVYDTWGETQEALNQYQLALKVFRDTSNRENQAIVLDNIGMVYAGLGDAEEALSQFQEALKIRKALKDPSGESVTRSNVGYAQWLLGNHEEALSQLKQALALSQSHTTAGPQSCNPRFEAFTLVREGIVHVSRGELSEALERYNQALKIQRDVDDHRGQAITLDRIGEVSGLLGQPVQALRSYKEALGLWMSVADPQGQALSLYGIARVERDQDNLDEARDRIAEAIEKVESLRTKMTSHRLRMTYFADRQAYYELEIDIRMRLYDQTGSRSDLELALFASERARARNLLDLLTETNANIRQGVDPLLLDRERNQGERLADKRRSLQALFGVKHTEAQTSAAEREIRTLTDEYDRTQAEIRRRSPRYASLTQPQPLRADQIRELLDDDTVLLEYALGEKRSYLWLVTRTEAFPFTLPGRSTIENAAQNFRESLTVYEPRPERELSAEFLKRMRTAVKEYPERARELSRMLLGPIASKIQNKRLVIVADGMLQYVPFGALPKPSPGGAPNSLNPTPLIAKNEIVYQPSASALALVRALPRPAATKTVAVLADPVFDKSDARLRMVNDDSKAASNHGASSSSELKRALRDAGDTGSEDGSLKLERLKYSAKEANAIVAAAAPGSWMKAVDFKASRATALSPELRQFKIVHFATHGILNGRHPELSGLVLSLVDERGQDEDGFLRLGDIYNLNLPVELVVLSACQTGVGKPVKGEGLVGLTRGFMHAGAARVVASLWKVDDEATAELMKRFYGYMFAQKMSAASALRQAQLDIRAVHEDPYYWAGFVLQGEWK